jgi:hypothetical protein
MPHQYKLVINPAAILLQKCGSQETPECQQLVCRGARAAIALRPAVVRGDDRRRVGARPPLVGGGASGAARRRYMHARGGEGVVRERRENATVMLRGRRTTNSFIKEWGWSRDWFSHRNDHRQIITLRNDTFEYMARYNKWARFHLLHCVMSLSF